MTNPAVHERWNGIRTQVLAQLAALPERIGRYAVRGELGRGGMGIVYDAWDATLSRPVAVKVIDSDGMSPEDAEQFAARFESEMKGAARVFAPNVVAVLDAGIDPAPEGDGAPSRPFYVMERIEGPSLEERLAEQGVLSREEILRTGAAIARGLAAAHGKGLVHRDLKPSNVLLPLAGEPKVADFGLCQAVRGAWGDTRPEPRQRRLTGSPHYMAPEQVLCGEVDPRADLFALGAVLSRMASGREPFHASTLGAHLYRILHDDPDGLEELDDDLRALVTGLMAKDPDRRPASAERVAEKLERLAAAPGSTPERPEAREAESTERTESRSDQARGSGGSGGRRILAAVLLLALLGAGLAAHLRNELVALEQEVATGRARIENQLARQHELLPRLVQVVERYAAYESDALRTVLDSARSLSSAPVDAPAHDVDRLLSRAVLLVDRLPALRADAHYRALMHEISGTKNRVAVSRGRYNEAVGRLNARLDQVPWRWFSGTRSKAAYFEPPDALLEEPELSAEWAT